MNREYVYVIYLDLMSKTNKQKTKIKTTTATANTIFKMENVIYKIDSINIRKTKKKWIKCVFQLGLESFFRTDDCVMTSSSNKR